MPLKCPLPLLPFSPAAVFRDTLARLKMYERKSRHMRQLDGSSGARGMLAHISEMLHRA
jgi:hypothetical protein